MQISLFNAVMLILIIFVAIAGNMMEAPTSVDLAVPTTVPVQQAVVAKNIVAPTGVPKVATPVPNSKPVPSSKKADYVVNPRVAKVIRQPTADKPFTIMMAGEPPNFLGNNGIGGKQLVLDGEVFAQALYDDGLRAPYTFEIHWVTEEEYKSICQPGTACFRPVSDTRATLLVKIGPYGGGPEFKDNRDFYNSIFRLETYRIIFIKVKGDRDKGGDGMGSPLFNMFFGKVSKYMFVK